jgi:2-iminobutanoate/2-iminopropanoate deaminase
MKPESAKRRAFMTSAAGLGAAGALPMMAAAAEGGPRAKAPGGVRVGNLYFSFGLTGERDEARKDPLAFGGDVKEQTERVMKMHKANLEAMGSSLENVIKVTVFMADVKTEKRAMNAAYAPFFPKDAPARSCVGVEFPDAATRLEIELVAYIPS